MLCYHDQQTAEVEDSHQSSISYSLQIHASPTSRASQTSSTDHNTFHCQPNAAKDPFQEIETLMCDGYYLRETDGNPSSHTSRRLQIRLPKGNDDGGLARIQKQPV